MGKANVVITVDIDNLDYESYKNICNKMNEAVRFEIIKEEFKKLCSNETRIDVETHEHFDN